MTVSPQVEPLVAAARALFAATPLAAFIEARHKALFTIDEAASVGDALRLLSENKILSAPVTSAAKGDEAKAFYAGCISLADILKGLVKQVEARRILHGTNWEEKVAAVKEADLVEIGRELFARPVTHFCHAGSLLLEAEEGVDLAEVLESGFNIHDSHPHHRIYVCHDALKKHDHKNGDKVHSAAGWRATDVVSQTDLLAFLQQHAKTDFPELVGQTLESLGLTATGVCTTSGSTTALDSFHKMFVDHHSCVGLVDDATGKLVGNLSVTDLRGLSTPESFAKLNQPALEFVKPTARPLVTLPPTATLGQLLDTLTSNRLRRVYIIANEDGVERIDGIVSITDVLRLVANPPIDEEGGEKDEDDEEMNGGDADEE